MEDSDTKRFLLQTPYTEPLDLCDDLENAENFEIESLRRQNTRSFSGWFRPCLLIFLGVNALLLLYLSMRPKEIEYHGERSYCKATPRSDQLIRLTRLLFSTCKPSDPIRDENLSLRFRFRQRWKIPRRTFASIGCCMGKFI
jgi:hypothetical protein